MTSLLKLGIAGTGFIAGVVARSLAETRRVSLTAVASRRPERARSFADAHGARAFDTWQELVGWEGLDAVYVATPTAAREEICLAAAHHHKHLLAEKPFTNLASLQRITGACRGAGVAFLDATHFTHHPRTAQLKRELPSRIGTIRAIRGSFFFPSMDQSNIRFDPAQEPTGAIGDMAWYNMRAVAEFTPPDASLVSASGYAERDDVTGAMVRGAGVLLLSNGCTSVWDAGYNTGASVMDLDLIGERGMISLDDFVLDWAGGFPVPAPDYPVGFTQRSGVVNPSGFNRVDTPSATRQVVRMIEAFASLAGEPRGPQVRESMLLSERTQGLLDAVWNQLTFV